MGTRGTGRDGPPSPPLLAPFRAPDEVLTANRGVWSLERLGNFHCLAKGGRLRRGRRPRVSTRAVGPNEWW
ncbi:hypothetical protein VFPFJ_03351 [Purpureocillium lilacinum]|uniref:Uncharacterized protein n=1 Tax=Purpureocillium lilacinum TaxID=33203 RepID=A0A179GUC0_PURLI|nr:hypothetical protein VFPFJ_03351 [Purpureocillium lilacinum]OAQ81556.1 hypothetical protein VFPBJ_04140 [Purpureocillium lilacinum]OAQ91611.1 hypothetical protein VFPFJ_03351 [Purpureocillium lilacinum]